MKALRELIGLCKHKWEVKDTISIYADGDHYKLPIARKYIMQCTHCGKIKSVRV